MDRGITDFYKTATSRGFARTNLFRINSISRSSEDIYRPDGGTPGTKKGDNLFLYAQNGTIPSRTISTTSVDFKSFKYTIPMVAQYTESSSWAVTFYCDRDYIIRNVLEKWSVDTFDEHTSLSNKPNWWDCNIELHLLNNSGPNKDTTSVLRKYNLIGAFLQNVGAIEYATAAGGDIARVQATIGYQYVTSQDLLQS